VARLPLPSPEIQNFINNLNFSKMNQKIHKTYDDIHDDCNA